MIGQQLQHVSELQSKLTTIENEKYSLSSKNDVLEKKVESLVKFLEQERRMRYELEDKVKKFEAAESGQIAQLNTFKEKAEQVAMKEQELKA